MIEVNTMPESLLLKIDYSDSMSPAVELACQALDRGELVVAPTETQYGILARIDNKSAMEKLFKLKGRDISKPVSVFVKDINQMKELAETSDASDLLASIFLPGPLTLVLKSKRDFGNMITSDGKTGFRNSASLLIQKILEKTEVPVTATSANFSGSPAVESAEAIRENFGSEIAVYLDGGYLNNPPSTVIEVIDDKVSVLRESAISESDILEALK